MKTIEIGLSYDSENVVVSDEQTVKEVIEEFDFVITFEELIARQYENLESMQQAVSSTFDIDM